MDKRDSWQPTGACGRCPWSPWHEGVKGWQSAEEGLPSQQSEGDEGRLLVRRMRHWGGGRKRGLHTQTLMPQAGAATLGATFLRDSLTAHKKQVWNPVSD